MWTVLPFLLTAAGLVDKGVSIMFDLSGSAAALDSFQLIVALYLFYLVIKGDGPMYRFFDLPNDIQCKAKRTLRIIYLICGFLALIDAGLCILCNSMFSVVTTGGEVVITQNYFVSALPFLSYSFIETASYILIGLIVAILCGAFIWLRTLNKRHCAT